MTWDPYGEAWEVGGVKAVGEHQRQAWLSSQFYHKPAHLSPPVVKKTQIRTFGRKTTYAWSTVAK